MRISILINPNKPPTEERPNKARLLVCDFGYTADAWAEALSALLKKSKEEHYDGDILLIGGVGDDIVQLYDFAMPGFAVKFKSKSARLSAHDSDVILRNLVPRDLPMLDFYDTIEIMAMGLGVRYAAYLLNQFPERWFKTKTIRGIALGGTVTAVDDKCGIPQELWASTLDNLNVANMEQYYLNLFNSSKYYFNLRFAPINLADKEPRKTQSELSRLIDFKKRLEEVATFHIGEAYAKVAANICYQSARPRLFQKPTGVARDPLMRRVARGQLTSAGMMEIMADLCFAPVIPLGELGRSRFDQCFKLHYAYTKDIICPAAAIKADAGSDAEVRELDSPHFNCEQICQLLLQEHHPDWEQ